MKKNTLTLNNKVQGALIGGAIGDAIGFLIEKKPLDLVLQFCAQLQDKNTYLVKNRVYQQTYDFGQYSDDTQFSRLLILSHIENKNFKDLLIQEYPNLTGLGKGTNKILKYWTTNPNTETPSELTNNISNGSVMRSWAIGLLYDRLEQITQHNLNHGQLTHNTKEAINCSLYIAKVMNYLVKLDDPKNVDIDFIISLADHEPLLKALVANTVKKNNVDEIRNILITPNMLGWEGVPPLAIPTTVGIIASLIKTIDSGFKDTLIYGLSLGGDTDTVCSVLGALKGCLVSVDSIEPLFRNIVHDKQQYKEDYLIDLSSKVVQFKQL